MAREYTMRQGSFFRRPEWDWLNKAVLELDVQEWIAKKEYSKSRAVLVDGFRRQFTTPAEGETDAAYKKRRRGAKKGRKNQIVRIRAETEEEFKMRMLVLPDRIGTWLANWRHQRARKGGKRWQPPPVTPVVTRKPRAITAFEAFCKRGAAPQGADFVGKRCNLGDLSSARKAAWDKLSAEEQDNYRTVAIAMMVAAERSSEFTQADAEGHPQEVVAHAEDIAAHVDGFVNGLHDSVGWGGVAIFGGPDEKGEGRIHMQVLVPLAGIGTNRHGETFLDVLLKTIHWTQLEFDTVFSLWVEQCREGPQNGEDATFALTARRAIDYVRAQAPWNQGGTPPYTGAVSLASTAMQEWAKMPAPVFRFPVANYSEQDEFSRREHVLFNALQNLSLSTPTNLSAGPAEGGSAGDILGGGDDLVAPDEGSFAPPSGDDEPPPIVLDGEGTVPEFPPEEPAALFSQEMTVLASAQINYDPMCLDVDCALVLDVSEVPGPMSTPAEALPASGQATEGK